MVTAPDKGREIIDAFLATGFKTGWDEEVQAFLDRSMVEIHRIESQEFKESGPGPKSVIDGCEADHL